MFLYVLYLDFINRKNNNTASIVSLLRAFQGLQLKDSSAPAEILCFQQERL